MLTCELTALGLIEVPPRPRFSRSFLISGRYKDCGDARYARSSSVLT